jgi:hypothetical protein
MGAAVGSGTFWVAGGGYVPAPKNGQMAEAFLIFDAAEVPPQEAVIKVPNYAEFDVACPSGHGGGARQLCNRQ